MASNLKMKVSNHCEFPRSEEMRHKKALKPGAVEVSFADTGLVSPIQTCLLNPGF